MIFPKQRRRRVTPLRHVLACWRNKRDSCHQDRWRIGGLVRRSATRRNSRRRSNRHRQRLVRFGWSKRPPFPTDRGYNPRERAMPRCPIAKQRSHVRRRACHWHPASLRPRGSGPEPSPCRRPWQSQPQAGLKSTRGRRSPLPGHSAGILHRDIRSAPSQKAGSHQWRSASARIVCAKRSYSAPMRYRSPAAVPRTPRSRMR